MRQPNLPPKRKSTFFLFFIFLVVIIGKPNSATLAGPNHGFPPLTGYVSVPYVIPTEVVIDGIVSQGEYPVTLEDSHELTGIIVSFSHNGTDLFVALESPTKGWVGIGLGPKSVPMDGANIIMGYVSDNGTFAIEDHYGLGTQHFSDIDSGGTNDIKAAAGTENETHTVIEFVFPLSSGDSYDHSWILGQENGFHLANHPTADNFGSYHPDHSNLITIKLETSSIIMPLVTNPIVSVDGIIGLNEYESSMVDPLTEINVYLEHNNTDMFIGLISPPGHSGWLGIGFGPKNAHKNGSNIIIGFVNATGVHMSDDYGEPGEHHPDISANGTFDIKASGGTENATHTIIEFVFPLKSGDIPLDHDFSINSTYGFFLSHNRTADDFVSMHPEHSITYDLLVSPFETLNIDMTVNATDTTGTSIPAGTEIPQGTRIILEARFQVLEGGDPNLMDGRRINMYLNFTFGRMLLGSNITNTESTVKFVYDLENVAGLINFVIEFPGQTVGTKILANHEEYFTINLIPEEHVEEFIWFDDPRIFGAVSAGALTLVAGVFLVYGYVLYNAVRIRSGKEQVN
ncbi:MAG: DOMON domain-containing protein [Candidatus Heimdallarchaeota archaeon]